MRAHRVASIPGDGIGLEVVPAARRVLDRAGELHDFELQWTEFEWGCEYFARHGAMMPQRGLDILQSFDQIFLGAVGAPEVPDHISLWQLLIPIRRRFHQYVNLRPIKLLAGVESPLRQVPPEGIDFVVVRENSEGEYAEIGGRLHHGPTEMAVQESIFTRVGVERIMRYAFGVARSRHGGLVSATKSNGIVHTMPFWDEICSEIASLHPDVPVAHVHVDALAAAFVSRPWSLDVVVASNLFGDILTDLGAAVVGSIGMAPSANLNPEREFPSMFEPIHGSAPDIAGQNIANPIGQIWSGSMMLDHLGHHDAAAAVVRAIESVLTEGRIRTPDLGGTSTTTEVADAIAAALGTDGKTG